LPPIFGLGVCLPKWLCLGRSMSQNREGTTRIQCFIINSHFFCAIQIAILRYTRILFFWTKPRQMSWERLTTFRIWLYLIFTVHFWDTTLTWNSLKRDGQSSKAQRVASCGSVPSCQIQNWNGSCRFLWQASWGLPCQVGRSLDHWGPIWEEFHYQTSSKRAKATAMPKRHVAIFSLLAQRITSHQSQSIRHFFCITTRSILCGYVFTPTCINTRTRIFTLQRWLQGLYVGHAPLCGCSLCSCPLRVFHLIASEIGRGGYDDYVDFAARQLRQLKLKIDSGDMSVPTWSTQLGV
jgi:hypothetical protein